MMMPFPVLDRNREPPARVEIPISPEQAFINECMSLDDNSAKQLIQDAPAAMIEAVANDVLAGAAMRDKIAVIEAIYDRQVPCDPQRAWYYCIRVASMHALLTRWDVDVNMLVGCRTQLHHAVYMGRLDVIVYLLNNGADPYAGDEDGHDAFSYTSNDHIISLLRRENNVPVQTL